MKVVVLGGSSISTPALFQDMNGEFGGCDFTLVGRSARQLEAVAHAATQLAGVNPPTITPLQCDVVTSGPALAGADVVLIQMRIGNMAGRRFDESFPLRFDQCGDEGLGAGGMSAAWRSWPIIEEWLKAIVEYAPHAMVLMMSSPVGALTRAAHLQFPALNCLGICEVPYKALLDVSALLCAPLDSIDFDYLGVNHIGWLYAVRSAGRDLVREWADYPSRRGFPAPGLIHAWSGIPTKYLKLHFESAAVVAAQKAAGCVRADLLETLQASGFAAYATASNIQLRALVSRRETPWYSHSVAPLLKGLLTGESSSIFFLSGRNEHHRQEFHPDDILEEACLIRDGAIQRIPPKRSPPHPIAEMIRDFCEHERRAANAIIARNESLMRSALEIHPWIACTEQPATLSANLATLIIAAQHDPSIARLTTIT